MPNVFELLEREWSELCADPLAARRLGDVCRIAGHAGSLADVEQYVRHATAEDADKVLLALVTQAVDRDQLAARVLLQLLLPGTRTMARRWWAVGDYDERAATAVAAVYQRICNYPLERRPGKVAANVLLDAARDLRRAVPPAEVTLTPDFSDLDTGVVRALQPPHSQPHPADELLQVLREAVRDGILQQAEAQLIARSRLSGHRLADLATERGIPERTLFSHRHRAERVLAADYLATA